MKTVLITGGSGGIGSAIVHTFSAAGWNVLFTFCSGQERAKQILASDPTATPLPCDFSVPGSAKKLAAEVLREYGKVDCLINNAGMASYGLFQDVSEADFDRMIDVNLKSMYFLTSALVKPMIADHSGSIINVSSIWGETGASCEVLYSAVKAAVIGFTKALAKELAPSGISVNCIAPGVVDTAMLARFSAAEKAALAQEIPTGRFVETDEIARLVYFLASGVSPSLTGQVIGVNGAMLC